MTGCKTRIRVLLVAACAVVAMAVGASAGHSEVRGSLPPDQALAFSQYPIFDIGPVFEGLAQTQGHHVEIYIDSSMTFDTFVGPVTLPTSVEPPSDWTDFIYGDCTPPEPTAEHQSPGCFYPIEIQTWPTCMRNVAQYPQPLVAEALIIRGAPALSFDGGTRLEIYTGNVVVVIFDDDPLRAIRVANALKLINGLALDPAWAAYVRPFTGLGLLPAPIAGSITGTLPCHAPPGSEPG